MGYVFHKADKKDLTEVVSLYQQAITRMIESNILQWDEIYPNEEVLSGDIDRGELYLLIEEKLIAACVVINEEQDESYLTAPWSYNEGKIAVIHRLCVHPRTQGSGLGKKTMQFAEELIQDKGYSSIRLDTFSQNRYARQLYENLGYHYVGEVTFRKGLFYLMEKFVDSLASPCKND